MNDSPVEDSKKDGLFSLHSTEPWHCGIPQERLADVERTAEEERHMMQQQLARASSPASPASAEVDAGICRKRHPNQQISSEAEAQEEVRATEEKWKEMKVGNG